MTPNELIKRFNVMVEAANPDDTVMILPLLTGRAREHADYLTDSNAMSKVEGHVTAQDLEDFLDWLES